MTKLPITPKKTEQISKEKTTNQMAITEEIVITINNQTDGLKTYPISELVKQAERFGNHLKEQRLKTNQVRKFLDAINRLKVKLTQEKENNFEEIRGEIILLKPKLAYAAARQKEAKDLNKVVSTAIDKVTSIEDFNRLVQLIEATIAYHKAAGGE